MHQYNNLEKVHEITNHTSAERNNTKTQHFLTPSYCYNVSYTQW